MRHRGIGKTSMAALVMMYSERRKCCQMVFNWDI